MLIAWVWFSWEDGAQCALQHHAFRLPPYLTKDVGVVSVKVMAVYFCIQSVCLSCCYIYKY
jgi:hypothetical protein